MIFKRFNWIYLAILAVFAAAVGCETERSEESENSTSSSDLNPPNIIFIFTDDQGYADISANGALDDIQTPNIDSLAQNGVRMTSGYATAPQCSPSRAALMTGVYQQRFGLDSNADTPMSLDMRTIASYLQSVGYHTGMAGKWNLDIDINSVAFGSAPFLEDVESIDDVPESIRELYMPNRRGFNEMFCGYDTVFQVDMDTFNSAPFKRMRKATEDRVTLVNDVAVDFINRNASHPFFFYLAPFAPHVPLAASDEYLNRFPESMPVRRRYALAMMSAIDDGVGRIVDTLKRLQILDNTLIFFISDNGAPLGLTMTDGPVTASPATHPWNGSMNTPLTGEKGFLMDGGIRVPYVVSWPARVAGGQICDRPVSTLDAAYTALKAAGVPASVLNSLDGVDLLPAVTGNAQYLNERPLFWRFWRQYAVRLGDWKYLRLSDSREYLFFMDSPEAEISSGNRIDAEPEKAEEMRQLIENWDAKMSASTYGTVPSPHESEYFDEYLPLD